MNRTCFYCNRIEEIIKECKRDRWPRHQYITFNGRLTWVCPECATEEEKETA